jgi:hypothetical protein
MEYEILHDDSGIDFWEFEERITFISGHKNYSSQGTKYKLIDFSDMSEIVEEFKGKEVIEVYAYIHGNIALSLNSFNCRWDSGLFGLLVFEKGEFGENNQGLKDFITSWASWLNGEVYGYQVQDDKGEVLDSCWGFIGYEHCEEAAKESLTYCVNAAKLERTSRIKTLIKNRVPLEVRLTELTE